MTAGRQQRKLHFRCFRTGLIVAGALAALGGAGLIGATAAEPVVVDRNSGLAINGFDPVAYFTDAQALPGKGEFEQLVAGAVWRFRNAGNQAAFVADPDVYRPRFGGYDPVGLARGVAVPGNPLLWVISAQRLYFFYAIQAREEFAADRESVLSAANRDWPSIQGKIIP